VGGQLRRGLTATGAIVAALWVCGTACGCGSDAAPTAEGASQPRMLGSGERTSFRFFAPRGFWNAPLPRDAPLDPRSTPIVKTFSAQIGRELEAGNGPWINTTDYSVPVYLVGRDQPTVRVQLSSRFSAPALQSAWRRVPLPPNARPSRGSDRALVVWQPHSDRLWEFWRLARSARGWSAAWGGAMRNASSNPGAYGPGAWPGAKRSWGSSASSLSIAGGLITFDDLRRGWINHALAIAIPNARAGAYAAPARRTDGTSQSPASLPEGAHLRLDPSLDLGALRLPRLTRMIAMAAQRYGIFVRDKSRVTQFFAQDPSPTGRNPYLEPGGYFEAATPSQLLASFPWGHLQLLAMDLRG
jgi:hypothetical protein